MAAVQPALPTGLSLPAQLVWAAVHASVVSSAPPKVVPAIASSAIRSTQTRSDLDVPTVLLEVPQCIAGRLPSVAAVLAAQDMIGEARGFFAHGRRTSR